MNKYLLKNRRSIVRIIFLALVGIYFVYFMIEAVTTGRKMGNSLNDALPTLSIITTEDSSLISKKYISHLKPKLVFQGKHREPVSIIYFDSVYNLIIYKIIPVKKISLKDIFNLEIDGSSRATGEIYSLYRSGIAEFQYLSKAPNPARKIYLGLSGDSIKNIIRNDTALSYHLSCNSFSIKYGENEPFDVVMNGRDNEFGFNPRISTDLLFLYRNNVIYLFVMIPEKSDTSVKPGILFNIVSGS
jgi:hypothetical protein